MSDRSARGVRPPPRVAQLPPVETRGQDAPFYDDVYHHLLVTPWWRFFAIVTGAFLVLNAAFAVLYLAEPGSVSGARPGSFEDAFFFSVQTLATIGYGTMAPATFYGHCVVTLEALFGLMSVALMTGLAFARFSRPTARILFAQKAVIARMNGAPTLMLRMANWRGNMLVEAQLRVAVLVEERTAEGDLFRRPVEIALVRDRNATFFLSWTAMHRIDDASPFTGDDALARLRAQNASVFVSLSGVDETTGTQVHARHVYSLADVVPDARFADVISTRPDGTRVIDYARFHDVEPAKG